MADSSTITIQHPDSTNPVADAFFVASGLSLGVDTLVYTLKDANAKDVSCDSYVIQDPEDSVQLADKTRLWMIGFENVPAGGPYTLEVRSVADNTVKGAVTFTVQGLAQPPSRRRPLVILYPPPKATIKPWNFIAYGQTIFHHPIQGVLSLKGAPAFMSYQKQGPPDTTNWILQFAALPLADGHAHLHVCNLDSQPCRDRAEGMTIKE